MRMYDIIAKKRDGGTLTRAEIAFAVNGLSLIHISEPTKPP